ncbi:hypothetical protein AX16_009524 [Volvariella volvacea WC 439]|nr:hypothetical protein AX16_009524 [Volvariella volvacea WC 439]
MTYPPPIGQPHSPPAHRSSPASRFYQQRPRGSRPLPTGYPSPPPSESPGLYTDESDTVYSSQERKQAAGMIRTASISRGLRVQGASVVGLAPATIHNVSSSGGLRTSTHPDPTRSPASPIPEADERDPLEINRRISSHGPPPQAYHFPGLTRRKTHDSTHTTRSAVPSFISRISSNRSVQRVLAWARKPLPPVPIIADMPLSDQIQHRNADDTTPLPDLVHRAGTLHGMLEKGYHPHHSSTSDYSNFKGATSTATDDGNWSHSTRSQKPVAKLIPPWTGAPSPNQTASQNKKQRLIRWLILAFIIVAIIVIGVAVGVTVSRRESQESKCQDNQAGAACNLDASCVCTSTVPGRCNSLAKSLVDLVPTANQLLDTNLTTTNIYDSIWFAQGAITGTNCASQAVLVDVAPALDVSVSPNRTAWAQSALLWTLAQSQDLATTRRLKDFVQQAPWNQLSEKDGPVSDAGSSFSITQSNFIYDFASQTILPINVSFIDQGEPTNAQIAQVNEISQQALDRMYSYASASSMLRQNALATYWTNILGQRSDDLPTFISALSVSPIMLPFDATYSRRGHHLADLMTNSTTTPFPPPPSCYPGLTFDEFAQLEEIEGPIYGLPDSQIPDNFDTSCFSNRPLYGVLDVLHLRLPFPDQTPNASRQAVVLNRDVSPRAIIRSGSRLSAFPSTLNNQNAPVNPRQYGTLSHCNHVILSYLQAMPSTDVAVALVRYVLSSASAVPVPPGEDNILSQALSSIPTLEVTVFGSIDPSDVRSVASALADSSGNLFFGTPAAGAMRFWAINAASSAVIWTESATSQLIVRDNTLTNNLFNLTWEAAAVAVEHNVPGVGVHNITTAFQETGLFTNT